MAQTGCKGCTERQVGCHSKCEKYKAFQEMLAIRAKNRNAYREGESAVIQSSIRRRAARGGRKPKQ